MFRQGRMRLLGIDTLILDSSGRQKRVIYATFGSDNSLPLLLFRQK